MMENQDSASLWKVKKYQ